MNKHWIDMLLVLLLSACATSTHAPGPVSSPTPMLLPDITVISPGTLDSILVYPFPLPAGTLPNGVTHEASSVFDYLPPAQQTASVDLIHSNTFAGNVTVFVYEDEATRLSAYQKIVDTMGTEAQSIDAVGEQAAAKQSMIFEIQLVFRRCTAVADISLYENVGLETILTDAQTLDKNLQDVVCK